MQRLVHLPDGDGWRQMGTALRLQHNLVNHTQSHQVLGSHFHNFTRLFAPGGIFPEDRRKTFRREHGVNCVFQHQHPVGNRQGQGAAAVALSSHHGNHRHRETAHLKEVSGNGLSLSPFLRLHAGIGAGGINKCEDGPVKFLRLAHQPQGLAIPLGAGHAEVEADVFLQRLPLSGADHRDGRAVKQGNAPQNRRVLSAEAVSPQLHKVGKEHVDIVRNAGALRVPRNC